MARKLVKDERIEHERYRAGYYAFLVGGALFLLYYFLWSSVEFHSAWLTSIMPHLILFIGTAVFFVYRMMKYNKALREERWLRREQDPYRWLRLLAWIPVCAAYVVTYDYLSRAVLFGETIVVAERWGFWVLMSSVLSIVFIVGLNTKPDGLDAGDTFPSKKTTDENANQEK